MNNKHPHHDLIVEWAKDTSKQPQIKTIVEDADWSDCSIQEVVSNPDCVVRFKPREFVKGHWYPCLHHSGDVFVMMFDGCDFARFDGPWPELVEEKTFKEIGESLGEINFGGGD